MTKQTVRYSGSTNAGTSIAGLLGVAFIILKLTGVIAWSWWWVLAPFWVPLASVLLVGGIFLLFFAMAHSKPRRRPSAAEQRKAWLRKAAQR